MTAREQEIAEDYARELEPCADVLVRFMVAASAELGPQRARQVLGGVFDAVFLDAKERVVAGLCLTDNTGQNAMISKALGALKS